MRVAGITISDEKRLEVSLTDLYGIGHSRAKEVLDEAGIDHGKKASELSEAEETKIREVLEQYKIEGDLRREKSSNIKRLKDIGAYRGTRHTRGLPTKGQRTKTNSRTARPYKGRKTMGSGRTKVEKT